jgi:hypothetical protein
MSLAILCGAIASRSSNSSSIRELSLRHALGFLPPIQKLLMFLLASNARHGILVGYFSDVQYAGITAHFGPGSKTLVDARDYENEA